MIPFVITFPILIVLAASFFLRDKGQRWGVAMLTWVIAYQFFFIGLLGVGLIQSHIGCPRILDDCYIENYPPSLYVLKDLISVAGVVWVLAALWQIVANIWRFFRRGRS